ncbi:tetratricopeptide repeat protein [Octadecabacter sp. 1_MG-2023]|uniref:tetratricopeptide repeat protein n=1 Tax=unclassified Octadecabacter TaxID=196158 RepID=UPI001C088ACC|nr:tetratricopeptide repeat protein [Octadecabacter sp. 1_MG-2023]MBU2993394.1 tetratricopeptide repeat protein [Octadecabacter sp. B2R22]MDO6733150.1 tetratricopeptide repeat protein [Octadecabacter sp. 1_MG-2023]
MSNASAVCAATLDDVLTPETIFEPYGFGGDSSLSLDGGTSDVLDTLVLSNDIENRLKGMVAANPQNIEALKTLAVFYTRMGRLEEAQVALERAHLVAPGDAVLALDIAKLAGVNGGVSAARTALEDFRGAAQDPFPFELALVQLENERGDPILARNSLERMIETEQNPERVSKLRLLFARYLIEDGEIGAAQAQVDTVISANPADANALAFRALSRLNALDLTGARADIDAGLAVEPESPSLLQLAARADWRAGQQEQALENLLKAVTASDYQPDIVQDTVGVLQERGRSDEALAIVETAVEKHADVPQLVAILGVLRLAQKDWAGAELAATALRQFGTPLAVSDSEKIRIAVLRGRGQEEEAQALLAQIGSSGSDIGVVAEIINGHLSRNDPAAAMDYINDLLEQYPNTPALLLMRASLNEITDQADRAQTDYLAVIRFLPQSPMAYVALAKHQMRNERAADAEATLRTALEVLPSEPTLKMPLVEILLRRQDVAEALRLMDELVVEYPDNPLVANNYVALVTDYAPEDPETLARAASVAGQLRVSTIPQLRDTYAWLLHRQGDHAAAQDVLVSVLEEIPDNSWANYHYGMVLSALGEREDAVTHLRRALASTDSSFDKTEVVLAEVQELTSQ